MDRATISRITDGIVADMEAWQSRPLDPVYPVLLVDGIRIKIGTASREGRWRRCGVAGVTPLGSLLVSLLARLARLLVEGHWFEVEV